jgi:hypothetical protein
MELPDRMNGLAMPQYPRAHALSSMAVELDVTAPATLILTAHEIVRIDRMAQGADGAAAAERHGDLLRPGTNTIQLDPGSYHFCIRGAARLHLIDPDSVTVSMAKSATSIAPPSGGGTPDHVPALTVSYDD